MTNTGFYPGSFDPVTNGHLDIIQRALNLVDRLVIGVGVHHGKKPLFSAKERVALLEIGAGQVEIVTFDNLTVNAARSIGASVIIRGLRDAGDLEYEMQMAGMNSAMAPDIETVFLASSPDVRHIAGNLVRQIASMGGDISKFVPASILPHIQQKFAASDHS